MGYVVLLGGIINAYTGEFVWKRLVTVREDVMDILFNQEKFVWFRVGGDSFLIDRRKDVVYKRVGTAQSIDEFKVFLKRFGFDYGFHYFWNPFSRNDVGFEVIRADGDDNAGH